MSATTSPTHETATRYPLAWPAGWPRTAPGRRTRAKFVKRVVVSSSTPGGSTWTQNKALTVAQGIERLMVECDRLGAVRPVLSSDMALRLDGMPRSDRREPEDPGVAIYFLHRNKPIVLACDKWDRLADNIAAIAAHIEAIRAMDRYGVGRLEQALAGYQRLLGGKRSWFEVLGFAAPPTNWAVIEAAYKSLVRKFHPDVAPDAEREVHAGITTDINEAFQTAKQEFGR